MDLDDRWADWKDDSDRMASPLSGAPEAKRRAIAVNLDVPHDAPDFSKDVITPGYKGSVLKADDDATLVNLVSRPDLNRVPVTLLGFVTEADRWTVCILPINLHGFPEGKEEEDKARRMATDAAKLSFTPRQAQGLS